MKYGLIGTGNMGSMLTHAFISSGAVQAGDINVYNRSPDKAEALKEQFPEITVAQTITEAGQNSEIIFICVKPHHYEHVLDHLTLSSNQCLVSITSPVSVNDLEKKVNSQVARIVPSITNRAHAGVSLFTFGDRIHEKFKKELFDTFSCFSKPVEIEEEHIRVSSDIVSCGPAFVGFLLENMIESANKIGGISQDQATVLMEEMIIGLAALLEKDIYSFPELIKKVTVKGGVTGEGLVALEENIDDTFLRMFQATHYKHYRDKLSIKL
ncbi:late competence protein ComER [Halobacillus sp. A5]|uniref:late competence protein ComER n=1 Tax=Halobacillus sp. A5 TaxID=2880263 RepID=UPI0020A6B53A|nr:late competence protein ComER [Halobacillus sp. A5]MCP3025614.1 late competence protein ComER [Halobacillus sp. A5]